MERKSHEYKVVFPWNKWITGSYDNKSKWCNETFGSDNWDCCISMGIVNTSIYYFKYEKDAALFKLKYL